MRSRPTLSVVLLALLLASPAEAHPADVEWIPPERYVEVALREIQQAKSSIRLTMYLISLPWQKPDSPVRRLVDALAAAAGRGVDVQVVLDQNVAWDDDSVLGLQQVSGKNGAAARSLQARGVHVFFDDATTLTHAKALVVDGTTTLLGSTNWSETALTQNVEANALIRSAAFAREVLKSFAAVARREAPVDDPRAVPVPWAFLSDRQRLGRMAAAEDEGAFDLYLYLLRTGGEAGGGARTVGYEPMAAAMGLQGSSVPRQRRTVQDVLRRLQRRYGLLTVSIRRGPRREDPVVALTGPVSDEAVVRVPPEYWSWGWDRRLPLRGKVLYLLGLHYAAVSPTAPVWFRSQQDLAAAHGFTHWYALDGLMVLRRCNLIEVQPGLLTPGHPGDRPANRYVMNPLYDPVALEQRFLALETRYGRAAVQQARASAALVYEDSDAGAVERLLQLEVAYGPSVVQAAARKVGAKHWTNPKRSMAYLIRTIESMGRGE